VHNLTLNGISLLAFDKESKATKQATKPEVAEEEDILFQLASDDDVSDFEDDLHLEDVSDYKESPAAEDDLVT
jgi:hypothetical protein